MSRPGSSSAETRVGLVLAGGGIAGYGFHTGALAALASCTGWDPRRAEIIVGTSAGSIVASLLRAGMAPDELRDRVLEPGPDTETDLLLKALVSFGSFEVPGPRWGTEDLGMVTSELARMVRRRRGPRLAHLGAGLLPIGRVSTEPLRGLLDPLHGDSWPAEPLWIPATDHRSGRRVVFGPTYTDLSGDHPADGPEPVAPSSRPEGNGGPPRQRHDGDAAEVQPSVATAVRASCAIPGYFAPVQHDGRRFVDGGLGSADNSDLLAERGLDVVVICSPLSLAELRPQSPIMSVLRAYPRRRLGVNVRALEADGVEVIVLEPDRHLSAAMGWTAMATRRLRSVVDASERHITEELAANPSAGAMEALSA
ncbi:MAG: patatin-like phospholipase family protein [Actinomycetota bacterium]